MKKLRALAISDLHLGESDCLLYDNKFTIQDKIVEKIASLSSGTNGFEDGIEELILLGDIIDLSEAPDKQAYAGTKDFLSRLFKSVPVDKLIFIPGNHDHYMWVQIAIDELKKQLNKKQLDLTDYYQNIFYLPKKIENPEVFITNCIDAWDRPVEVWYPNYAIDEGKSNDRKSQYFFFDHGHLFAVRIQFFSNHLLYRILLGFQKNIRDTRNLKELEQCIYKFIELMWHTKDTKFYFMRESIYDWLIKMLLTGRFYKTGTTSFNEDYRSALSIELGEQIRWYLSDICDLDDRYFRDRDFHFIFGHTHRGGRVLKEDKKIRVKGSFISIWNTGGWIVPSKVFSPDAFIFYIQQDKDPWEANMYKLVKYDWPSLEGDYDKNLLTYRANTIP